MSPLDVGPNESRRTVDRAVDMRLGGEVEHRIGIEFLEDAGYGHPVADVGLAKGVARIALCGAQGAQICRVGQLVDIENGDVKVPDQQPADRRTDKSGAAGYQNSHS